MAGSYFISKVYRQHTSMVIVIPRPVSVALGIKRGDNVVFQWKNPEGVFVLQKFEPIGEKHDGDTEHTNNQDQSRPTSAEEGGRR